MGKSGAKTVTGLQTAPNNIANVSPGGLLKATNCVVQYSGLIEPRRGMALDVDWGLEAQVLGVFQGNVVGAGTDGEIWFVVQRLSSSTDEVLGSFSAPPAQEILRPQFQSTPQLLYCTSTHGVVALGDVGGSRYAGVPQPVFPSTLSSLSPGLQNSYLSASTFPNAVANFLPVNSAVGYRLTCARRLEDGTFQESAPSSRLIVRNPPNVTATLARASNVVTASVAGGHFFVPGDTVALDATAIGAGYTSPATVTACSSTYLRWGDVAGGSLGPTAGRTVSSGTKGVQFRFKAYTVGSSSARLICRVYRTRVSPGVMSDPGDEQFLISETFHQAVSGVISFDVTDTTPEAALTNPLYTNPSSGDGILQAHSLPPRCWSMAAYQGRGWYARADTLPESSIQLIAPITVGNFYTSWTSVNLGTYAETAQAITSSPSTARQLELNSQIIVNGCNAATAQSVASYAACDYLASGGGGKISIRAQRHAATSGENPVTFWYSNYAAAWAPSPVSAVSTLIAATGAAVGDGSGRVTVTSVGHAVQLYDWAYISVGASASSAGGFPVGVVQVDYVDSTTFAYTALNASVFPDGTNLSSITYLILDSAQAAAQAVQANSLPDALFYSALGQPEAVPALNFLRIGTPGVNILQLAAVDDFLYVFKEDGVFGVSGAAPFSVNEIDKTCVLLSPDTVVALEGDVYALTSKGVVRISGGIVTKISEPIDDLIVSRDVTYLRRYAFAAARPTQKQYFLFLPNTAPGCDEAFVYSAVSGAWTRVDYGSSQHMIFMPVSAANTEARGALARTDSSILRLERLSSASTYGIPNSLDYADEDYPATISSISGETLTLASATYAYVGGVVNQGSVYAKILEVNGNDVLVSSSSGLATGAATTFTPYTCAVEFIPDFAGSPDEVKHFRDTQLSFQKRAFYSAEATFVSDMSNTQISVPLAFPDANMSIPRNIAGLYPMKNRRVTVPTLHARSSFLGVGYKIREAFGFFRLAGYTNFWEGMSERINRGGNDG